MNGDLFATDSTGQAVVRDRRADSRAANESTRPWQGIAPEALAAHEEREEQAKQIKRVAGKLAESIRLFLWGRGAGATFYASELHEAVGGAPASSDRVLRMLRQSGEVTYSVVSRSASLYRIETLSRPTP